ncbi:MAG: endonuclease III [Acidobacteria bacterium]|nr:endonuclease III [Acidobacteriota bacterium]
MAPGGGHPQRAAVGGDRRGAGSPSGPGVSGATSRERARVARVVGALIAAYPDARCALNFGNPLECLVATVLSAQCTDARVNLVTKDLFRRYPTAADYAGAAREEIEEAVRSTGFFRSKARSIQGLAAALVRDHGGKVPSSMEELIALPGVGRKTANLVLGESFGIVSGIVVDTHVHRLSRRLGLTAHDDPVKIERDLMEVVPASEWIPFGTRMITHGRAICDARKPRCAECPLLADCPAGVELSGKRSLTAPRRRG